ncbi:hypothetical protein L6452_17050 [Arctium lappa]|uniref:Uncharacterized protein n=1 Tax=Arctium lappa TaxID=4217 RepID=A0ACB9C2A9_ARCLA|nr:hypothetical protein L6452_17050 [Arctium lappa]
MGSAVCKVQTTYIKGRSILDGPVIVNEIIKWAKRKKKKTMIFKVDFEKAFDSLNWGYLDDILNQMGFGEKWRAWVRGCISTARVSVLVNGSPTKKFHMEKGVRQGDPLAPFLFILDAEGLNVARKEAQNKGLFKGIHFDNMGEEVSILQYADDTIFLGDWSRSNAANLVRILKCFQICSGLKVNMEKGKVMGVMVNNEEVKRMARLLHCREGSIPFTYLGMPMGEKMARVSSWKPIIEKFKVRLSDWKARNLSIGGRLCLCKSVLGSLGSYFFSLFKVPSKVINILESIRCRFFWGGSEEKRKFCWVAWDKVLNSKENGGLVIGSLKSLNLAMLGKWWWRYRTDTDAMWRGIVNNFYGSSGGLSDGNRSKAKGGVWGSIVGLKKDLDERGINLDNLFQLDSINARWKWVKEKDGCYSVASLRRIVDCTLLPGADRETYWNTWVPAKVNVHLSSMEGTTGATGYQR